MEDIVLKKSKGGRPRKAIKMTEQLAVMCTLQQREVIEQKAKESLKTVSEYLRTLGLNGKVVMLVKTIPPEHLMFTGALNHVGALLNQIAKKRNANDDLNYNERVNLKMLEERIKAIVINIEKM